MKAKNCITGKPAAMSTGHGYFWATLIEPSGRLDRRRLDGKQDRETFAQALSDNADSVTWKLGHNRTATITEVTGSGPKSSLPPDLTRTKLLEVQL